MFVKRHKTVLLVLLFLLLNKSCFALSSFDSLQQALDSLIILKDSIDYKLSQEHKEERREKVQKALVFLSYINYSDRGSGINFRGVEAYAPYAGKTIRQIDIKIYKPFNCMEDSCEQTLSKGKKFGNAIHFESREWQARQDILFKKGQKVNPVLFADTEKLLWARGIYKNVQIVVYDEDTSTNEVDVAVLLQDRLSWSAAVGYYNNKLSLLGRINNFFGLPNTLQISTGVNFNKNNLWSVGAQYWYKNILGSQIDFTTAFLYENLNKIAKVSLSRSFFSIKSSWAFDLSYAYNNSTVSLNGNLRDPSSYVHARSNYYSLWLAYAAPVNKMMPCKDDKLKFLMATRIDYTDYKDRPFIVDKNYTEQFIETSNYRFGLGLARWDYYLEKNAYYLEIPEYFPKGMSVTIWAGPQHDEIYGKRSYLGLTVNEGVYWKKFGYLYGQLSYDGYIRNKKAEQMLASAELHYLTKRIVFSKHLFFRQLIKGKMNYGFFVPEERYFNLNDFNGIRGFYSSSLKGSKSLVLSLESDLYLDKKVAMTKGMLYVFCDMGWLSKNDTKLITQSIFQYGLGFGFRLRSVDLGLPFLDLQFAFYPKGKDYDFQPFQFRLYQENLYALPTNNLFYEYPQSTTVVN